MKKKYINNLPNGKEVIGTGVSAEDGKLVVEVEFEDEFDPKDGDFSGWKRWKYIYLQRQKSCNKLVYSCYCGVTRYTNDVILEFSNNWTNKEGCRFATPEEKSAFLERLEKECHKKWNAETKKLEDIRWRPNVNELYYFINSRLGIEKAYNVQSFLDKDIIEKGNCFKNVYAAQPYADKFKEILKNSKAE